MRLRLVLAALALACVAPAAAAATLTWINPVDNRWSNAANWSPAQVPQSGDRLLFGPSADGVLLNDLPPDVVLEDVNGYCCPHPTTFAGGVIQVSHEMFGNFTFEAGVRAMGDLTVTGNRYVGSFDGGGFRLNFRTVTIDGSLTGTGTMQVFETTINGNAEGFTGLTKAVGTLTVNGKLGGRIEGNIAATLLTGTGTVGDIGGALTIRPGDGFTCGSVDVVLARFSTTISGTAPGTWGKLVANGTVALHRTSLDASLGAGFSPPVGREYVLIENDGADPVVGTFSYANLWYGSWVWTEYPEGAHVSIGGVPFRLSYAGGDGNDVTVTSLPTAAVTLVQSKAVTVWGEPFTLTATVAGAYGPATGKILLEPPGWAVPLVNGAAVQVVNSVPPSAWQVEARYPGDRTYGSSASPPITHDVLPADTTLALTAAEIEEGVRLTATVDAVAPSERAPEGFSVQFFVDGTPAGNAPFARPGLASVDVRPSPGPHAISATFVPSPQYHPSSASDSFVVRAPTSTTAAVEIAQGGAPAVITVTVEPAAATGTATIFDGTTAIGSGNLSGGKTTVTTPSLAAGDYTLRVEYSGDALFRPSATGLQVRVAGIFISADGVRVDEGDSGAALHSLTVRLSESPAEAVRVDYATADGTAIAERDYVPVAGTLMFAPGETSQSIALSILANRVPEADKELYLNLSDPVAASLGTPRVTVTIADDDVPGTAVRDLPFTSDLQLDLFLPEGGGAGSGAAATPLIVGIDAPDWDLPRQHASIILNEVSRGYAVALVTFRSPATAVMPAQIADVRDAVRWLRIHAVELGLDPNRFGAWGIGMAGGHLAALLATGEDSPASVSSRVQAAVDWYGMTDFSDLDGGCEPPLIQVTNLLGCRPVACPQLARNASVMTWISGDDAPLLAVHGANDCVVRSSHSSRLVEALRQARVDATLVLVPRGGHGYPGWDWTPLLDDVHRFFERTLRRRELRHRAVRP